jgi:hypothetical protein
MPTSPPDRAAVIAAATVPPLRLLGPQHRALLERAAANAVGATRLSRKHARVAALTAVLGSLDVDYLIAWFLEADTRLDLDRRMREARLREELGDLDSDGMHNALLADPPLEPV